MANYKTLIALAATAIAEADKADNAFIMLLEGVKASKIQPEELKEFLVPAIAKRRGLKTARPDTGRTAGQIGFVGDDDTALANARKELQRWSFKISTALGWTENGGNSQTDPATKVFNAIAKLKGQTRSKLIRMMQAEGWV